MKPRNQRAPALSDAEIRASQRLAEGLAPVDNDRAEAADARERFRQSLAVKNEEAQGLRRDAAEKRARARALFLELAQAFRAAGYELEAQEYEHCARDCAPLAKGKPRHVDYDDY